MTVEGVFDIGVAGMGPALTPKGAAIVNEKMARRDAVLDELEARGLNVRALAHRHREGCGHDCGEGCMGACPDPDAAAKTAGAVEAPSTPATLEEAHACIQRMEGRIAHLEHSLAVKDNMVLLLREALQEERQRHQEAAASVIQ